MADEWFEFATKDHFWMQWRHRLLIKELRRSGVTLHKGLEIGCGHAVAREMLERDLAVPIDACDLNQDALQLAKSGIGQLFLYDIFDQDSSMLGQYDAVFLLDVLEHIDDDAGFLQAALTHLRPGGIVVINVPAYMLFFSNYDRIAGHVRRYTPGAVTRLFHHCGLEVCRCRRWGLLMAPMLLARKWILRSAPSDSTIRKGFVPPNRAANLFLQSLKELETSLPFGMPFGTSLLAWARTKAQSR